MVWEGGVAERAQHLRSLSPGFKFQLPLPPSGSVAVGESFPFPRGKMEMTYVACLLGESTGSLLFT